METNNTEKFIDPNAKKVWRIGSLITSIILLSIVIVINYFYSFWWTLIPVILLSLIISIINPIIEYKQWKYLITEKYVKFTHGIYFKTTTRIPINRIQHIDISESPFQKIYNLASIKLYTAGSSHEIDCINKDEANKIVEFLNKIILGETENGKNSTKPSI